MPCIGGVSIHVSRLAEALSNEGSMGCLYNSSNSIKIAETRFKIHNVFFPKFRYDTFKSLLWLILYGIRDKSKILHLHGHPIWESPTLFIMILLKKNLVFTIHDQIMLDNIEKYPKFLTILFRKLLEKKNIRWIAVSQKIKDQIHSINPICITATVIPAYIPSLPDNKPLNPEIENFIKTKTYILSIYAHSTRIFNGKDLYGIDIALKALSKVNKIIPNTGLIISIPGETLKTEIIKYQVLIDELQLHDNVLIFLKPINNSINLWKKSNILLRPTLTDGDSLVIREALSQGVYIIASNVVKRPDGVILFQSENIDELAERIIVTLKSGKTDTIKMDPSYFELIKKVYSFFL